MKCSFCSCLLPLWRCGTNQRHHPTSEARSYGTPSNAKKNKQNKTGPCHVVDLTAMRFNIYIKKRACLLPCREEIVPRAGVQIISTEKRDNARKKETITKMLLVAVISYLQHNTKFSNNYLSFSNLKFSLHGQKKTSLWGFRTFVTHLEPFQQLHGGIVKIPPCYTQLYHEIHLKSVSARCLRGKKQLGDHMW